MRAFHCAALERRRSFPAAGVDTSISGLAPAKNAAAVMAAWRGAKSTKSFPFRLLGPRFATKREGIVFAQCCTIARE